MLVDRGISSRVAAYTTAEPGSDVARLASEHDVDLVLVDSSSGLPEDGHPDRDLGVILEHVPCDVAVLMGAGDLGTGPSSLRSAALSTIGPRSNSLRGLRSPSAPRFVFSEPKRTQRLASAMPAGS